MSQKGNDIVYTQEIQRILRELGIGHRFAGYNAMVDAVSMVLNDSNALFCCKSFILQPLAERYHCPPANIVRNLRTVIAHAWQVNPTYLCILAGYPLQKAPSSTEFIDILSTSIIRHHDTQGKH